MSAQDFRGSKPMDFTDEKTLAYGESLVPLAGGPRVRVLEMTCGGCGEQEWPFGAGVTYTVAAAVLREIATQWHHDDCPGPMQFVTQPEAQA